MITTETASEAHRRTAAVDTLAAGTMDVLSVGAERAPVPVACGIAVSAVPLVRLMDVKPVRAEGTARTERFRSAIGALAHDRTVPRVFPHPAQLVRRTLFANAIGDDSK